MSHTELVTALHGYLAPHTELGLDTYPDGICVSCTQIINRLSVLWSAEEYAVGYKAGRLDFAYELSGLADAIRKAQDV